ncbi:hypothetical protein ACEQPO_23090 [Bacillus sp. SL00103]
MSKTRIVARVARFERRTIESKLSDDTWSIQEVADHLKRWTSWLKTSRLKEKKHRLKNMSQSRWNGRGSF